MGGGRSRKKCHHPGQASALATQDEVRNEVGAEVTLDFSNEGDHLSLGHDKSAVLTLPGPRIPDPEVV